MVDVFYGALAVSIIGMSYEGKKIFPSPKQALEYMIDGKILSPNEDEEMCNEKPAEVQLSLF